MSTQLVINNIGITYNGRKVVLSADVAFDGEKSQSMYFAVDSKFKDYIIEDASPFVAAVLLPCMNRGENIHVEGKISKKFFTNSKKIMELFKTWNVGLKKITINASMIEKDKKSPNVVASFFSGGVDSFYTFLKHRNKSRRITHFILVNGFDIELNNLSLWEKTVKNIQNIAEKEKITLITVETNLKYIIEPRLIWDWGHGGALGAVAQFLRGKMKQVYIPASIAKEDLFPYGTHPDLDYLWGTEILTIIHDGNISRVDKVKYIASFQTVKDNLRVCSQNTKDTYNCGKCFKCLRTMIELTSAEVLSETKTFKKQLDLGLVKNMRFPKKFAYQHLAKQYIKQLKKSGRHPELVAALQEALQKSNNTSLLSNITELIANFDKKYNKRRIYSYIFKMNSNQDRNFIFKMLFNVGIIK